MSAQTDISDAEWKRVNPLAIAANMLRALPNAILPVIAITYGTANTEMGSFLPILVVVAALVLTGLSGWISWIRLRYCLGDSDIQVEKGLISRQARSVPYERIQDVSLEQKLVPRLLGLAEVRFETGAGGKDELKLAYVSMAEGARLREAIRDRREGVTAASNADVTASSGSGGEAVAVEEGSPLFAMDERRLFTFGLFEFSLVVLALLGAALQQFDLFLPDMELWNAQGWEKRASGPGEFVDGLSWVARIWGLVAAIIMLGVLGMVSGVVRTFLRDWDFRLEQTPKGFRRRRGLLTKTDVVMPAHRVQAISISTGLLRRIWGWHGLSFISLAQDAKAANHVVAPFATMQEIAPIVAAAHFALPTQNLDWHRPSAKYRTDLAILSAIIPALVGLGLIIAPLPIWLGIALISLAALLALRQHFLWRYERHALDPRHIFSRRGWLAPKLKIADRVKLHSVAITQGPLAKRRGYAHIVFGLAGGTFSFNGLPLEEAEVIRASVLASIAEVDFSRLPR